MFNFKSRFEIYRHESHGLTKRKYTITNIDSTDTTIPKIIIQTMRFLFFHPAALALAPANAIGSAKHGRQKSSRTSLSAVIYRWTRKSKMLEKLCEEYLKTRSIASALQLIRSLRCQGLFHLGNLIGNKFTTDFPDEPFIADETGICQYYTGNFLKSFNTFNKALESTNLLPDEAQHLMNNRFYASKNLQDTYTKYNSELVETLTNKPKNLVPFITLTMTTCKRLDLFRQTVNSFIACCTDCHLIDRWLIIDDNSSTSDREEMQRLYPFMEFYWKSPEEKGHAKSMNLILRKVTTPYIFHMEDDWKFYEQRPYLSQLLVLLNSNEKIGQALINRNYAETPDDKDIVGGTFREVRGFRFCEHERMENTDFHAKYGVKRNCAYWPHYSLRPSLLKRSVLEKVGQFNEGASHFEMEFAYRYLSSGYVSVFLEGIYCTHIGRLTKERHDPSKLNAYALNNEAQFGEKVSVEPEIKLNPEPEKKPFDIPTFVINLDRRPDRWEKFQASAKRIGLTSYTKFRAIDGAQLNPTEKLQRIFDHNDYNMRQGIVGCAMSHIALWIEFLKVPNINPRQPFLILEDDAEYPDDFTNAIQTVLENVPNDWDVIFITHHHRIKESAQQERLLPKILLEKRDFRSAFALSLGGTGGYLISRTGAERMLNFISQHGMTNAIDTVMQKAADTANIYYTMPVLIQCDCVRPGETVDSDIQYDHTSLTIPVEDRLKAVCEFLDQPDLPRVSKEDLPSYLSDKSRVATALYESTDNDNLDEVASASVHPCYPIANRYLVIIPRVPSNFEENFYLRRLVSHNKFSLDGVLNFKQN